MDPSLGARNTRALCLLAFDAGGIGALSSLLILREIMRRVNGEFKKRNSDHQTLYPWQVFDMICGTGTGGLTAIMLGRLRMPVEDIIGPHLKLTTLAISKPKRWSREGRSKTNRVKKAVNVIIGTNIRQSEQEDDTTSSVEPRSDNESAGRGEGAMMHDGSEDSCPVFVCDVSAGIGAKSRLRTYAIGSNDTHNHTIWAAACTTLLIPPAFSQPNPNAPYGQDGLPVDSAIGNYNPSTELLNETSEYFSPDRQVACMISIGTGRKEFVPERFQAISINCERVHQKMADKFYGRSPELYFRFNVEADLRGLNEGDSKIVSEIHVDTLAYAAGRYVGEAIDRAVRLIVHRNREGMKTIGQIAQM